MNKRNESGTPGQIGRIYVIEKDEFPSYVKKKIDKKNTPTNWIFKKVAFNKYEIHRRGTING